MSVKNNIKKNQMTNSDYRFTKKSTKRVREYSQDGRKEGRLMPLEFIPNHAFPFRRRYATSQGINGNLSIYDILNSFIVATTSILGSSLARAIRVSRIQIWTPVTTNGTAVFVTLRPIGQETTSNCFSDLGVQLTDTSQTLDRVAYVDYKTKKTMPSGSWHRSIATDQDLFNIVCAAGSVMDVDFECVMGGSTPVGAYTTVLVGATAGTIYCRSVVSNFVPVGVNLI